ncbi:MAG: DUF3429 domain-containing protein [Alphaproteobacteria bacterium]|nr:DUF3429 domain-containing protein [Alphaproteobacteria bacterium]
MEEKASPTALLLGWGGVIPFVATALAFHYGPPYLAIAALQAGTIYGAVIITFIGAVHWGFAMRHPQGHSFYYIWSVIPSLLMAGGLMLAPIFRPALLIMGLALVWGVDMMITRAGMLPRWYMKLRHGLTLVAGASLLSFYMGI